MIACSGLQGGRELVVTDDVTIASASQTAGNSIIHGVVSIQRSVYNDIIQRAQIPKSNNSQQPQHNIIGGTIFLHLLSTECER